MCGTWSLVGIENDLPLVNAKTYQTNYTNEWGVYHTYRLLKNITGIWCLQEIARLTDYQFSYQEMAEQAASVHAFLQEIDLNHNRFNNPKNMIEEIQAACRESGQPIPKTVGELVMCVYSNLARIYARELK